MKKLALLSMLLGLGLFVVGCGDTKPAPKAAVPAGQPTPKPQSQPDGTAPEAKEGEDMPKDGDEAKPEESTDEKAADATATDEKPTDEK